MENIKFNEITKEDIKRWNAEIVAYNKMHELSDDLNNAPSIVQGQVHEASNYLLSKAYAYEKMVTNDMRDILDEHSYLVELEHCIKGKNRLEEKIYHKSLNEHCDIIEATNRIYDTIRYTIILDYDTYVTQLTNHLRELENLGYDIVKIKNRWGDVYYKGVSVQLEKNGIKLEVQFHTKENYEIKEVFSREPYKLIRQQNAPIDLLVKAYLLRRIYQMNVHIPPNILEYEYSPNSLKY